MFQMGADIHAYLEIFLDGRWQVQELNQASYNPYQIDVNRDYSLFDRLGYGTTMLQGYNQTGRTSGEELIPRSKSFFEIQETLDPLTRDRYDSSWHHSPGVFYQEEIPTDLGILSQTMDYGHRLSFKQHGGTRIIYFFDN